MAPTDLASLTSSKFRCFLNSFDTVLCDCDGVIWNSGKPTPGVKETFEKLKQCGKKIAFISNNNLYGTFGLYKNLTELYSGWEVEDVVIPAQAIIAYLNNKNFNKEVFIVGSASMKEEFAEAGLKVANKEISTTGSASDILQKLLKGDNNVGAVVFDYDIFINYLVLVQTSVLLKQEDIIFITGATDKKVVVGKNILLPGPHSFLNALLDVVDKTPLSFGKPSLNLTKFIESKYNIQDPSRVLFVGDSISQDIEFGSISGYQTLFVLTGVSTLADVENTKNNHQVPNYFIDSLGSINELVENKLGI